MRAEVESTPVGLFLHSPAGIYKVVMFDASEHVALTVRVASKYSHLLGQPVAATLFTSAAGLPRKGWTKHVQVWSRQAKCDKFVLRFEIPFAQIANAFRTEVVK